MPATIDTGFTITAEALLAIPPWQPERLFTGDDKADGRLYRMLALGFHPDRHPAAADAFKHLSELKAARDRAIDTGTWRGAGVQSLALRSGRRLNVRFLRRQAFELGTVLIGARSITWLFREEHRPLYAQALRTIKGFGSASREMWEEVEQFLPHIQLEAETDQGPALVVARPPDAVRLRDALDHLGGRMDPRHVAWILSTLHNVGAYLQWAGLTHNAIDLDSYFISPAAHSGVLLGGWWYARPAGETLTHLPASSARVWKAVTPAHEAAARKASPRLDRELIRLIGRSLLGDPGGTRLLRDAKVPKALRQWLTTPGAEDGIEDYANWARARHAAFGPRKFVVMDLTPREIYGGP